MEDLILKIAFGIYPGVPDQTHMNGLNHTDVFMYV